MSLEVKNLTHIYNKGTVMESYAVKNVSFTLEDGSFVGLIGHTGSGKSTLIQHLNGLETPTEGTVLFHGEDIFKAGYDLRRLRGKVGLVFQYPEYQLFEETVLKDVMYGPINMGLSEKEAGDRAQDALARIGLGEQYWERSPFELSGGEKRRAAIAGILAMEPEVLTGAGTVLTKDALRDALSAGAQFVVAPGFNPSLAEEALAAGVPYIPGVMTPTEIEAAMAIGLCTLKFFPAEAAGGVKMLKALSAPYRTVRFMPTGGITPDNLRAYLALPSVFCCGGSFVADGRRIAAGDFDGIADTARDTAALVRSIRGGDHV